jgi:hypothetical protein
MSLAALDLMGTKRTRHTPGKVSFSWVAMSVEHRSARSPRENNSDAIDGDTYTLPSSIVEGCGAGAL